MDPIVKHELFSPLGPMADAQAFGQCLARHGIIQSIALEDPEEYDSLRTIDAIRSIYDEISAHLSARAQEALDILSSAIDQAAKETIEDMSEEVFTDMLEDDPMDEIAPDAFFETVLKWKRGPKNGGEGTAGMRGSLGNWWDGDHLLCVVNLCGGDRDIFAAVVLADGDQVGLSDDNGDDIGWLPDDLSWYAKIEESTLPPLDESSDRI